MSISTTDIPLTDIVMAVAEAVAVGLAIYGMTRKPLKTISNAVASIRDPRRSFVIEFPNEITAEHIYRLREFDVRLFGKHIAIVSGTKLTERSLSAIVDARITIRPSTAAWIRGQPE